MSMYRIVLTGWHADTVTDLELDDRQIETVRKLAEATQAVVNWTSQWQPSMYVKPHTDPDVQRELAIEAERRRPETEMPF